MATMRSGCVNCKRVGDGLIDMQPIVMCVHLIMAYLFPMTVKITTRY
jgi:hypothetical protein